MVRALYVDNGVNKGAWTDEEDEVLRDVIQLSHGKSWSWRLVSEFASKRYGLARNAKSCRLRWVNYLRPGVRRGNFSKAEENLIVELHAELGNKWSAISARLPGRTDNEIKNFWHGHIVKRTHRTTNSAPKTNKGHEYNGEAIKGKVLENQAPCQIITPIKTAQNKSISFDPIKLLNDQSSMIFDQTDSSDHPNAESQIILDFLKAILTQDEMGNDLENADLLSGGDVHPLGFEFSDYDYSELSIMDFPDPSTVIPNTFVYENCSTGVIIDA